MDWPAVARDGALLALVACALIAGLLRANPRLFLRHFPAVVRDRLPPKTPLERRWSVVAGLLLITVVLGGLILSTLSLEARLGGAARFGTLALHAFAVGMVFNLADWLILDELWIGRLRPRWLSPPELTDVVIPFEHGRHFKAFLKGTVGFAILGAIVAAGVRATG